MLYWPTLHGNRHVTNDVWETALRVMWEACHPDASRFLRDGSLPTTRLDRSGYPSLHEARTRGAASGVTAVQGVFGVTTTGRLRRVYCRDGDHTSGEYVRVWMTAAVTGAFLRELVKEESPPFDDKTLDGEVNSGEVCNVAVVNLANVVQTQNYVVGLEFAQNFGT